jgi:hypothetical protein
MKLGHLAVILVVAVALALPGHAREGEPDKITVQHILIGYKRTVPGKKLERTKKEAKALAAALAERARAGEDFTALVEEYTDDKPPGIYVMTNKNAPRVAGAMTRDQMVPRFGDVAFGLEVGEVGVAVYHAGLIPYGWHIIKRLE